MIISDLEHLEVVHEENRVEGGVASVAGAAASSSAIGTNSASIFNITSTLTSITQSLLPGNFAALAFSTSESSASAS